jgi:hypothetical protein
MLGWFLTRRARASLIEGCLPLAADFVARWAPTRGASASFSFLHSSN